MNFKCLNNYISISEKQMFKFSILLKNLIEFNKKVNLTSIKSDEGILYKHFVDSILYGQIAFYNNICNNILDLGTGAGFPGIPLAILFPNKNFFLLDSLKKRINFLKIIVNFLSLKNVTIIHERAEIFGKNLKFREFFDIALSRSVAYLPTLVEYVLPLIKIEGYAALTKEMPIEKELKKSFNAISVLGGILVNQKKYILPKYNNKRIVLFIKKINKTSKKYPRRIGIPLKKPL